MGPRVREDDGAIAASEPVNMQIFAPLILQPDAEHRDSRRAGLAACDVRQPAKSRRSVALHPQRAAQLVDHVAGIE